MGACSLRSPFSVAHLTSLVSLHFWLQGKVASFCLPLMLNTRKISNSHLLATYFQPLFLLAGCLVQNNTDKNAIINVTEKITTFPLYPEAQQTVCIQELWMQVAVNQQTLPLLSQTNRKSSS